MIPMRFQLKCSNSAIIGGTNVNYVCGDVWCVCGVCVWGGDGETKAGRGKETSTGRKHVEGKTWKKEHVV